MLVPHLRLDGGWTVPSHIGYSASGMARFFPGYDGGRLWVVKMQKCIRKRFSVSDSLSVAVGAVDAASCPRHRNKPLSARLSVGKGVSGEVLSVPDRAGAE